MLGSRPEAPTVRAMLRSGLFLWYGDIPVTQTQGDIMRFEDYLEPLENEDEAKLVLEALAAKHIRNTEFQRLMREAESK